ncbi:MAG: carboxypeptidase-like regulatory domain-containing protein [Nitrospiria bacterium]
MIQKFVLITGMIIGLATACLRISNASEYQEMNVTHGGTLSGKVTLQGPVPDSRAFPVVLYPFAYYCKKISDGHGNVVIKEYIVGPEQGLQDTVIAVQDVKKGKPFPKIKTEFISIDCMFHPGDVPDSEQIEVRGGKPVHIHPSVGIIRNDQAISVINKDPIIHNGQVFQSEKGDIVLNFPLPISNKPNGGIIHLEPGKKIAQMICGMHEFMQTWGYLVENPYFARTKRDGLFLIDQLPPGTYKVIAWHPHFKPVEKEIVIPANGNVSLDFEFDSSEIKHSNYEIQEKFRVGPGAHHHGESKDCEAPYC